jgi:outer membrane immunogenic protein
MKRLFLSSVAFLALNVAGSALAADMARPVYKAPPPPPPPPVYNWTGCYVGAGAGYGMFNRDREVIALGDTFIGDTQTIAITVKGDQQFGNETFGGRGWLGTAQFGCDYQFAGPFGGNWVVGAFIDGDWSNIRGDQGLFTTFRGEAQLRSSWAVGGRIGWLVTPNLLTYFSAGYTRAKFDEVNYVNTLTNSSIIQAAPLTVLVVSAAPGAALQLGSQTYSGFFIGSGVEYAIQWWPGLFWKTEYRFADYRSETTPLICPSCSIVLDSGGLTERVHPYVQTVRSELVWRFNWGKGPVAVRAAY